MQCLVAVANSINVAIKSPFPGIVQGCQRLLSVLQLLQRLKR